MGGNMDNAKELNKKHDSLYRGGKEQNLFAVAPYIFQFSSPTPFSDWFVEKGWGDSWGVLIKSPWPLAEMHKHFRRFLMVNTEDSQQLYFRYYDPRVLRTFLPTCDPQQLRDFFGPIDYFILEDENPEYALRYRQENGILKTEKFKFSELEQFQRSKGVGATEEVEKKVNPIFNEPPPNKGEMDTAPAPPPAKSVPDGFQRPIKKEEPKEDSSSSKPKSKWNMFD
jgi:hypothetical protein